jgi:hypothetical protein
MSATAMQLFGNWWGWNMCGPMDDEKQKVAREKFSEEFESTFFETFRKQSGILSASSPILSGEGQSFSVPNRPRFWQTNRNRGSKNRRLH